MKGVLLDDVAGLGIVGRLLDCLNVDERFGGLKASGELCVIEETLKKDDDADSTFIE